MNTSSNLKTRLTNTSLVVTLILGLALLLYPQPVQAAAGQYRGLKLPYAAGQARTVTGTHNRAGGRHALDFGMKRENVLAIRGGTVYFAGWDTAGGGNMLMINHGDNYCSVYLHLERFYVGAGAQVSQGQAIAVSGNTGGAGSYHLHVSVTEKINGRCTGDHAKEVAMIFDELPGRELVYGDRITSQNTGGQATFQGNPSSRLFFDQNYNRINLTVCADNLPGKTVYVIMQRPGREWRYSQAASSRCVTFWDMDGAGAVLRNTTYKTWAALSSWPNTGWSIPCYTATSGRGLCDSLRRQ